MATQELVSGWQRLQRKRTAIIGLVLIAISLFLAILGYWLAPDPTPNANRMIVEIGGKKPGYTQLFFLLPKTEIPPESNWWQRTLQGINDNDQYLPITGYSIKNDTLILQKRIDDGISEPLSLPVQSISKPLESHFRQIRFLLGTDKYGRDVFSRLLIGIRVSLLVGGIAMLLSLTIGLVLGAAAGYYGGRTDQWISWLINVIWSIPTLLLVFAITLLLGKGFWQIFIAVGLTMWVNVARIVRGQLLAIKKFEFVEAARALGYTDIRIISRHILPNILGPVLVVAASNFASAIIIEAGLSFLGVGVQPPQPSWGGMIKENYNFIITNNPMLALAPGFAIMILVLAFNLVGNGIRDALDVRNGEP
jgi:ABC-type dipeptide/oligopeptide/nickel transport system permease subunit